MYQAGTKVYFVSNPKWLSDKPDMDGIVHHCFTGADGAVYVIVEYWIAPLMQRAKEIRYTMLPHTAIWEDKKGESNWQKLMKTPGYAFNIAVRAGIYNEDGTLTDLFKDDPNVDEQA